MTRCLLLATCFALTTPVCAQVVQLPTFRTFGVTTSVRVPVGGTMSLGGNNTMSSSAARRGGLGPTVTGMGGTVAGTTASVTVIDHNAIDRRLRGPEQVVGAAAKTNTEIEEGKALVRYARKMRAAGNDSLARQAYRMAMRKLDQRLHAYAKREFERAYPSAARLPTRFR